MLHWWLMSFGHCYPQISVWTGFFQGVSCRMRKSTTHMQLANQRLGNHPMPSLIFRPYAWRNGKSRHPAKHCLSGSQRKPSNTQPHAPRVLLFAAVIMQTEIYKAWNDKNRADCNNSLSWHISLLGGTCGYGLQLCLCVSNARRETFGLNRSRNFYGSGGLRVLFHMHFSRGSWWLAVPCRWGLWDIANH